MVSDSPIPKMLEDAAKRIEELQVKIVTCDETLNLLQQERDEAKEELTKWEAFDKALRDDKKEPSEKTWTKLWDEVLDVYKKEPEKEHSPKDVANLVKRDRRGVDKATKELHQRGHLELVREEAAGRGKTRFYKLTLPEEVQA